MHERFYIGRKGFEPLPFVLIADAHFDLVELVQHIELCDGDLLDTIDHGRVLHRHSVIPTTTPWSPGGCTVLLSDRTEAFASRIREFSGEWAIADTRAVRFDDPDDGIH